MKTYSATIRNSRGNDINFRPALLQSVVVREQLSLLRSAEDMTLVSFTYNPRFPALEQRAAKEAWTPAFPAVTGRIAYCNGRFMHTPDTSVTYRRGRRVVTEWHALAGVTCS